MALTDCGYWLHFAHFQHYVPGLLQNRRLLRLTHTRLMSLHYFLLTQFDYHLCSSITIYELAVALFQCLPLSNSIRWINLDFSPNSQLLGHSTDDGKFRKLFSLFFHFLLLVVHLSEKFSIH